MPRGLGRQRRGERLVRTHNSPRVCLGKKLGFVNERGHSAKETEAEAGRLPVSPRGTAGPVPFPDYSKKRQRWSGLLVGIRRVGIVMPAILLYGRRNQNDITSQ